MKNILVLIDNSINARHLALSAMHIALKITADITFVHTAKKRDADDGPQKSGMGERNEQEALAAIAQEIGAEVEKRGGQVKIAHRLFEGNVVDLLLEATGNGAVDLVMIGSHRSGPWERTMFRTQMQDILENIACPILVIPKKMVVEDIHQAIFAVDLSVHYKNALRYVVAFCAPFGTKVLVNSISRLGFPAKPSEEDLSTAVNLDLDPSLPGVTFHTIRSPDVKRALLQTLETGKVDLLCLVHQHYGFLRGLFHTSISKQLADNAIVPILVLRDSYPLDGPEQ